MKKASASSIAAVAGAGLFLAAGGFAAAALTQAAPPAPTKTVTIDVATGPTGPSGPAGPKGDTGPEGPAGGTDCPNGFSFGDLVINHPGGQVIIFTCIKD